MPSRAANRSNHRRHWRLKRREIKSCPLIVAFFASMVDMTYLNVRHSCKTPESSGCRHGYDVMLVVLRGVNGPIERWYRVYRKDIKMHFLSLNYCLALSLSSTSLSSLERDVSSSRRECNKEKKEKIRQSKETRQTMSQWANNWNLLFSLIVLNKVGQ